MGVILLHSGHQHVSATRHFKITYWN